LEKIRKEMVIVKFEVLSWHLPSGGAEENMKNLARTVSVPSIFQMNTSKMLLLKPLFFAEGILVKI
jgi:hypothetical protein